MHEAREDRRLALKWLIYQKGDKAFGLKGHVVQDLSVGGIFLRTQQPIAQGEPLELLLIDPHHNVHVEVRGRVVWCGKKSRHWGVGIAFDAAQNLSESLEPLLCKATQNEDASTLPKL
jgi:Tfp pilus assembly protein PilZ